MDEKGFSFIAVEGDWPDCLRVNQYIRGGGEPGTAEHVLRAFDRWPTWMWANWEIVALAEWMRSHNDDRPEQERVGFYGLDVYSRGESASLPCIAPDCVPLLPDGTCPLCYELVLEAPCAYAPYLCPD